MLEQVLMHLNNWFLVQNGVYFDTYCIQDGSITLPFLQDGQYFRILGSVFNDGLHQYPATELVDEEFTGAVWALSIPRLIIDMAQEMTDWEAKNGSAATGPYQSESFGGYSYTKASGKDGGAMTVWDVYSGQLSPYRKIRDMGPANPSRRSVPPYYPPYPWR